jgi:methyl-accepting chemotaxis protein
VAQVNKRTGEIANNTAAINQGLTESKRVREAVEAANENVQSKLSIAHDEINDLEMRANMMFDKLVHSGMSPDDLEFVELTKLQAKMIVEVTEAALADGSLTMEALFDNDYREIPGSNPQRFTTRLTKWAEEHWQPIIEATKAKRADAILSCVPTSREGFLPIHLIEFSRKPTGDLAHDTKYCRNGRILLGGIDDIAKASEQDYMMAVYRHEGDGKNFKTVRNVYVPIRINGRRWGDAEIAYIL